MFTKDDISGFKHAMDYFGWVESCIITPDLISFTDKLYHKNWRLFPNQSKSSDRRYFPIQGEFGENNDEFKQCNAGFSVFEAMKGLDERLWFWAAHRLYGDPDYRKMNPGYCMFREKNVHDQYQPAYDFIEKHKDDIWDDDSWDDNLWD